MAGTTGGSGSERSERSEGSAAAASGRQALAAREFEHLRRLIHAETGISLSGAKRVLLESRLSKRLRALGLDSFEDYCAYLDERPDAELVPFINCVTTNKTDFFREHHHFEFLRAQVLTAVDARARQSGDRRLRIWSAGCSTGEEPYTIAMMVREWLKGRPGWDVRILASDIDTNVLATAAAGEYASDRLADVPLEWRERWFAAVPNRDEQSRHDGGRHDRGRDARGRDDRGRDERGRDDRRRAHQSLRDLIAFRRINLNDEPWPIQSTFDVIFCRNVIIYFDRDTQSRLLTRFARLLKPDGHLIIGHSESLAWLSDTFTPVRGVPTAYRLTSQARLTRPITTATTAATTATAASARPRALPPPSVPAMSAPAMSVPAASAPATPGAATAATAAAAPRRLAPGEVLVSAAADVLHAVTGASVLVALFDAEAGCGGAAIVSCDAGRDDDVMRMMASLTQRLEERGAKGERLRAKIFGGAAIARGDGDGPANTARAARTVEAVRASLDAHGLPIAAERIGGTAPLEIMFHTDTGRALVREARGDAA